MTDMPELSDPVHLGTVEVVDYLVGHAPDNEGQNPFGQDHVQDRLEEMDPEALRAVAMEAIWRLANPPAIPEVDRTLGDAATSIVRMLVAEGWVYVLEADGGAPVLLAAAVCEPIDLDPLQAALLADLAERKPS